MAELAIADDLTDETRAELDGIEKGTADLERQLRAATVAVEGEEAEQREAGAAAGSPANDAEDRERAELRAKVKLGGYVSAAIEQRSAAGAEAEYNAAVGIAGNRFPLELLAPPERPGHRLPIWGHRRTASPYRRGLQRQLFRAQRFSGDPVRAAMMWWPWSKPETREAEGGYTGIISALIEAQAAGTTQQASATAATEAVAGALSRAFADARVDGPPDIAAAISPRTLAQVGRDLVRVGESLHVIRMSGGRLRLAPASTWYWEGGSDPADWICTATSYGPSGSSTWRVPMDSVVFVTWGAHAARPYSGLSPGTWAADTSRLTANAERSLANEAGGPLAQLIPVPQDGGDGDEDTDPLSGLKSDIAAAKGNALLVETLSAGWGEGKVAAPTSDWKQQRLGPMPPGAMVKLAESAFARSLAAAGCSPSLFNDADGTSKREALRQWHLSTVRPLARMLSAELTEKFGTPIRLKFDNYPIDMIARAQVFSKLAAVEGISPQMALALAQIGDGDDAG